MDFRYDLFPSIEFEIQGHSHISFNGEYSVCKNLIPGEKVIRPVICSRPDWPASYKNDSGTGVHTANVIRSFLK